MSDFVKELNFDGDTFNDMKRDMNFVLQRLLGNMQEKECQEGTLTLKLDVSLEREYVPNYNPNIPGESREIAKPKFSHKVTSQMKVEDMKKGNLDTEMELFMYRFPAVSIVRFWLILCARHIGNTDLTGKSHWYMWIQGRSTRKSENL